MYRWMWMKKLETRVKNNIMHSIRNSHSCRSLFLARNNRKKNWIECRMNENIIYCCSLLPITPFLCCAMCSFTFPVNQCFPTIRLKSAIQLTPLQLCFNFSEILLAPSTKDNDIYICLNWIMCVMYTNELIKGFGKWIPFMYKITDPPYV